MTPMTIQELISVLEQQKEKLGPDYVPVVIVEALEAGEPHERFLVEEIATVSMTGEQLVEIYAANGNDYFVTEREEA
jgi:hypothetical protein